MPEPTVTLSVRLSPELYAQIKADADLMGLKMTQWMTRAALARLEMKQDDSVRDQKAES